VQQNSSVLFQSSRTFVASFFLGALLFLFLAPAAWAQVGASITGTVQDTSGAAVEGATVTVKSLETESLREVTTDEAGRYRVLELRVGVYELRVHKPGFEDALWTGIRLNVGEQKVEDVKLAVSVAEQEVTVTETVAQAPVVNTTTQQVTGLVSEEQVKELPLNGRSYDKLITLNPGTTDFSPLRSQNTTTSNGNAFSVDGMRPGDNLVLLNGVELTGASQLAVSPGGVNGMLGVDAVREFNMLSGTYGAEYGKRAGAQVTTVTQSGSNAVHGTLYEFFRHDALDAKSYFTPAGTEKEHFMRNQFGGSIGAPLKKDRIFFFANYEGLRQDCSGICTSLGPIGPVVAFVPNEAAQLATSPAMQKYLDLWPRTFGPGDTDLGGGIERIVRHPAGFNNEDFGTARLDYMLGPRDTLTGAYTFDRGNALLPLPDPLFASALSLGSHTFSLQETHIFSPRVVNSFIFGFSRASFSNDAAPYVSFDPSVDLVAGRGPGGIVIGGVTTTGVGAITAAGPNNASGVFNRRNLFTFTDNVQVSKGRHQLGFGVWFQRQQDNENTASRQLGVASFSSLANFQTGTLSTFQLVPAATELGWRSFFGAWYVQDTVKLRRNLTMTLGLRHEFDNGWNEVQGRASQFLIDPVTGALQTVPTVGSSAFTDNNAKKLFGPRVALAWDPFGNGSTAVHAGFGIYYSLLDALAFQLNSNPPFNGSISLSGSLPALAPFDPNTPIAPQCGTPGAPPPPTCTKYAPQGVQQNAKVPTVEKWNLSIEQKLSNTMTLRVGYVGSFAYHQLINVDPNTVVPAICPEGAVCTAGGVQTSGQPVLAANTTTFTGGPGGTPYIPWNNTAVSGPCNAINKTGCRPNPFLSSGFFWFSNGNASYHALQVEVTKRYSRHLQFRANYTWSRSLDINSAPTGAQANNQAQMVLDRFNIRQDWGPSALNSDHIAHFSATYELPFGRGQRWYRDPHGVGDKLASGWVLNMITTLQSGFPITPLAGSNLSGNGDTRNPDRPALDPNFTGPVVTGDPNQWFNPAAFLPPTQGMQGTLLPSGEVLAPISRGSFRGPGLASVDISLFKDTRISERVKFQFRTECFNVLNHANFGTPNLVVSTAGRISSTVTPARQIQFGMKIIY
jgi:carboxypeptidase family protein/TonB-dependent receptor-like protein